MHGSPTADAVAGDLAAAVAGIPVWYHTIELPGGIVTPGWFDLRGVCGTLPWPEVRGCRCLDVATYDGFFAFELERRSAAEVLATDIPDHADWDWPAAARATAGRELGEWVGRKPGGFEVAHGALGSAVERIERSVYDLDPADIGTFDLVVCGSLLLHLRDPVRALEAIRTVCHGVFLSVEEVSLGLSLALPRRPVADMRFDEQACQWWVANAAGHRRLLEIAGFAVERSTKPFSEPFGRGHPAYAAAPGDVREQLRRGWQYAFTRGRFGVPHAALLARPRL